MNKTDLAEKVAASLDVSRLQATEMIDTVMEIITEAVAEHKEVRIPALGIFKPTKRAARKARNPRTGETIDVPAKWTIKFKPAKPVLDGMN